LFGLDIITKPGILVFSHDFTKYWKKKRNPDMHAGLITAALTVLKETQGETTTAIKQVGYTLLLYEGVLTYGILTTSQEDPVLYDFLKSIILKFELMFLSDLYEESFINRSDFEVFREIVNDEYNELNRLNQEGLRTLLRIMHQSNVTNFIIFENKSLLQPVFTSMVDPNVNMPIHQLAKIFRLINDLCVQQSKEIMSCEFNFNDEIYIHALRSPTHWLVCLNSPKTIDRNFIRYELNEIRACMSTSFLVVP
jgi:hypothetical protein